MIFVIAINVIDQIEKSTILIDLLCQYVSDLFVTAATLSSLLFGSELHRTLLNSPAVYFSSSVSIDYRYTAIFYNLNLPLSTRQFRISSLLSSVGHAEFSAKKNRLQLQLASIQVPMFLLPSLEPSKPWYNDCCQNPQYSNNHNELDQVKPFC